MSITNAATSSTGNVANLTTVKVNRLRRKVHWSPSPARFLAEIMEVPQGYSNVRTAHIAEYGASSVGAHSENAALTATALPTIDPQTSSLASYGISIAFTSELYNQTPEIHNLKGLCLQMAVEAMMDYITHGATNGIMALASSMTAVATNTGVAQTFAVIDDTALTLRETYGSHLELLYVDTPKGINDLREESKASAGGYLTNQAMTPFVKKMIQDGVIPTSVGFQFEMNGINYFQTNLAAQVYTNGGDDYAILAVPPAGSGQQGVGSEEEIQGAISLAGRANPAPARPKAKIVAKFGPIGIAMFEVEPNGENAEQLVLCMAIDSWLSASGASRAIQHLS